MRKGAKPNRMTTKSPLPVFLLNDLFALPDLAYISGSFDPSGRLGHSDVLDIVGGGVDTKENDLDERQGKKVIIGTVRQF